ncbi:MAG: hypothetical protein JRN21_04370 [Nitrososphaerota archaeon]|nr:hypothetical protein [Nitrososphaerota archaeon]
MQAVRALVPDISPVDMEAVEAKAARLLDLYLNGIYGGEFAAVVEHHFRDAVGLGLYQALKGDPVKARQTLTAIFRSEAAVDLIVSSLTARLERSAPAPEREVLLRVLCPPPSLVPST